MDDSEEMMDTGENSQDQSDQVDRRANRIMKIFGQITECLENQKVARIKEMISQITDLCKNKEEKPVQELNKIYLEYLLMVEFRAGISVNLIKLSIQSFLMIEDDPENLGKKVKEMFMEMILTEHPTLALDMNLSDELLKTYFRLLSEGGSEEALHMRLMIVGMFGVGKTSLVRRLCGMNTEDVTSTEGIDIFTETCEVEQESGNWIISPDKDKEQVFNIRLQTLLNKYRKKDKIEKTQEIVYDRAQTNNDRQNGTNAEIQLTTTKEESEKMNIDFDSFSAKVDEKDLMKRASTETQEREIRRPTISLWDFAGQSIYYSTHHFFLNERSIYLLVLDLSKELDEMVEEDSSETFLPNSMMGNKTKFTCLEAFKFWMKSIYIYTKQKDLRLSTNDRQNKPSYTPKIVLIGTHKDNITQKQLNGRTLNSIRTITLRKLSNHSLSDLLQILYIQRNSW